MVADVGRGAHGHLRGAVGGHLELHDVGRGAGDVGRQPDGLEEVVAVELDARRVRRRQDLLVVGELPVDEAADEVDALDVEEDLVLLGREDHLDRVVSVGQDPGQLGVRAGGDHDARLLDRVEAGDRGDGDPVVVGGGERDPIALESSEDAGQDGASLIAGGREGDLGQGPTEDLLADPRGGPLAGRRDCRELVGVDPPQVRLEAPAAQVEPVAVAEL